MKNILEIKKRIIVLDAMISKWRYHYYVLNDPLVSDQVFDAHFYELKKLVARYPLLGKFQKSLKKVTSHQEEKVVRSKKKHLRKMLSLDNIFYLKELDDFHTRVSKVTQGKHTYYCELKIDGVSLALSFKKHRFAHALTRGDGTYGQDVTKNVLKIPAFQKIVLKRYPLSDFEVRGEIFITHDSWNKMQQKWISQAHHLFINQLKNHIKNFIKALQLFLFLTQTFSDKISYDFDFDFSIKNPSLSFQEKFNFKNVFFHLEIKKNIKLFLENWTKNYQNQNNIYFSFQLWCSDKKVQQKLQEFLQKKFHHLSFPFEVKILKNSFTSNLQLLVNLNFRFQSQMYSNPRNLASGSLMHLDSQISKERNLKGFFFFLSKEEKDHQKMTQEQQILTLKKLNFPTCQFNQKCSTLDDVKQFIAKIEKQNQNGMIPFSIDGIVVKVNEHQYYDALGITERYPNYWIAYKYPEKIVETKLLKIIQTVGRTGKITYVAKLFPVFLEGSFVTRATLHNYQYIQKLDIRINDFVFIKKAGGVIPKVVGAVKKKRSSSLKKWVKKEKCFYCQSQLKTFKDQVDQYCLNLQCDGKKIQALIHFASRDALDIQGLSDEVVRKLFYLNVFKDVSDFYRFDFFMESLLTLNTNQDNFILKLKSLKRDIPKDFLQTKKFYFGNKMLQNLWMQIQKSRNKPLANLLFGLNIRHVGLKVAKILSKHFHSLQELQKVDVETLINLDNIGEIIAENIVKFFKDHHHFKVLESLNSYFKFPKNHQIKFVVKQNIFQNQKFVISGTFSIKRQQIIKIIEFLGGIFVTQVSKNVKFFLQGKNVGSKINKAHQQKLIIIDEKQLFSHLQTIFKMSYEQIKEINL